MNCNISIKGEIGEEVTLDSVKEQYDPTAEKVIVTINSPGGEVIAGKAIYDFLMSLPQSIKTVGEEMVASIATLPFLAGDEREMSPNCEFLGHLPSMSNFSGDSDDFEQAAKYMAEKKQELAVVYSKITKTDINDMVEFMREDTPISATKAKEMGFVTHIPAPKEVAFKAVAKIDINKFKDMSKGSDTKLDKIGKQMSGLLDKIDSFLNPKALEVKNELVELADGVKIFVVSEDGELEGKAAFIADEEGNATEEIAPAGTHELNDGRSIVINDEGIVESVSEAVEADEEKEALENKIKELEASMTASDEDKEKLTSELQTSKEAVQEMETEMKKIQATIVGGEQVVAKANTQPTNRSNPVPDDDARVGRLLNKINQR